MYTPRDTSPFQDSAGTAPSGTPPPAQPPPPPQTRGTQSHSAPTQPKRLPVFQHFRASCGGTRYICIYMSCRDGGNTFTPERYRLELNSAHTFTGRKAHSDPHTVSGVFFFEKTKLECGKTPPAFRQRQAHSAVRHAARSRPARSATGHRAWTRASSRKTISICMHVYVYIYILF